MKTLIAYILKTLVVWCILTLLNGCVTTMPSLRSGNTEIGFGVFSNNIVTTTQFDKASKSPTTFGIRFHY